MIGSLAAFLDLLAHETRLHARLLELVREQQGLLIRGDADDLGRVLRAQEDVSQEIRGAEAARLSQLGAYAEAVGKDPEHIAVADLLPLAEADDAARLRAAQEDLATILHAIVDANRANAVLIRDHLGYIRNVVDMVTRTFSAATYGPGENQGAPVSLVVDRVT